MNKLNFSTTIPSQNLVQKGTVNIQQLLTVANTSLLVDELRTTGRRSADLLKNCKAFPRAISRGIDFLPTNVRLETSLRRILEARGGKCPLLYFIFCRIVILTPVRYNGGQVYKVGQYCHQTPVII